MDAQKALEERLRYYADMLLGDQEEKKTGKQTKRKDPAKTEQPESSSHKREAKTKSKKSLKKKAKNKHLSGIEERLKLFDSSVKNKQKHLSEDENPQAVNGRSVEEDDQSTVKVVVYHNPAKKRKLQEAAHSELSAQLEPEARFSMKLARHEVNKLGISGFVKTKREEAQAALAMKLGAKAGKKEYVNYKLLQEKKKKEKEDLEQTLTEARQHGLNLKSKKFKGREKVSKIKKELGFVDGQVGSYRDGVQFLKKADIERIKMSKVGPKSRR